MGNLTVKESGEMVNFISPNVSKITSFKVHFTPRQEGTGDPSPENVREITGWNGVEGYGCGKNLVPWIKTNFTVQGNYYNGFAGWSKLWEIPKRISYTYSVFIDNSNCNTAGGARVWLRDIDNSKYTHVVTGTTIKAGEKGISTVTLNFSNLPNDYYACWGLDLHPNAIASMPIVYESDQETAIISDWSSNIGTIYGGYVDLISGELVADNAIKTFDGSETWNIATVSSKTAYQTRRPADIASGAVFTSNIITRVASLSGTVPNNVGYFGGTYLNVYAPSLSLEEWTAMLTATPLQIIYELATPITHQLTPQQLSTLKGQNNFWSNADYIEIEYELTETFDIQKTKRKIILNQPHVESASGDIVTFDTDMKGKLKECKVYFSPVQEGEGDPSPENVREITGWNGVEGYSCGKNLAHIFGYGTQTIPDTDVNKYKITNAYGTTINTTIFNNPDTPLIIEQSQAPNSTAPSTYHNGYIVIETDNLVFGQKYNVSFKVSNITNNILNINLNNMKLLAPNGTFKGVTEIIDDVLIFKNVVFYQSTIAPKRQSFEIRICGLSFTLSEFMVTAVDNEDFTYEPYQGAITSIDWTDSAGTVYGGYVDLVSGELVAEWEIAQDKWGDIKSSTPNSTTGFYLGKLHYNNAIKTCHYQSDYNKNTICNIINIISWNTEGRTPEHYYGGNASTNTGIMYISGNFDDDLIIQIAARLETPIHYQLTPQQILTLKGINNVYSDTNGQMEIKYWKH